MKNHTASFKNPNTHSFEFGGALVEAAICIPLFVIVIFASFNFIPSIIQLNVLMHSNKSAARLAYFNCNSSDPESIFNSNKDNNNITKLDDTWENSGTNEVTTSYGELTITVTTFQSNKTEEYCILCSDFFWKPQRIIDLNSLFPKPRGC